MWAAPFIPDFKRKVRLLEALMSPKSGGVWTQECTQALNEVLRVIKQRLTLAIADPLAPIQMYVATGPETGMAVMSQ